MTVASQANRSPGRAAFQILIYYVVFVAVAGFLLYRIPAAVDLFTLTPGADTATANDEITQTLFGTPLVSESATGWDSVWITAVSLLGALFIMIPSTWAYILIKRETGYEESVVHALLILPIVVGGVVMIVKTSVALAFSLAGIVAAVRFRTTLNDTKDAVYVFMAIGVGLAAGEQALGVALVLSIVFNAVNLALWQLNFGNPYADQLHRTGGLGLGTAIAGPASSRSAVGFGDKKIMEAVAPANLDEVTQAQARMRQYLQEETLIAKERKRYQALLLYTKDPGAVQNTVEPILDEWTLRWQLAEVVPGEGGVSAMTYLVRLREGITETTLVRTMEAADEDQERAIEAAELRSLKALAAE